MPPEQISDDNTQSQFGKSSFKRSSVGNTELRHLSFIRRKNNREEITTHWARRSPTPTSLGGAEYRPHT